MALAIVIATAEHGADVGEKKPARRPRCFPATCVRPPAGARCRRIGWPVIASLAFVVRSIGSMNLELCDVGATFTLGVSPRHPVRAADAIFLLAQSGRSGLAILSRGGRRCSSWNSWARSPRSSGISDSRSRRRRKCVCGPSRLSRFCCARNSRTSCSSSRRHRA